KAALLLFILLIGGNAFAYRKTTYWHDRLPVKVKGKWGYINSHGHVVISPRFDLAMPFENLAPVALVMENGHKKIINFDGKVIAGPGFNDFYCLDKDYIAYRQDTLWGIISTKGDTVLQPAYRNIEFFYCDYFKVTRQNKYGLISVAESKEVLPPQYNSL